MTDYLHDVLDELVPRFDDQRGDWDRIVTEAREGAAGPPRRSRMRRLMLVASALVAIALPVVGAASQEWWFFGAGSAPRPITDVHVVKTGLWEGEPWELAAYVSADTGICFYATQQPEPERVPGLPPQPSIRKLVGLTNEGAVVACLVVMGHVSYDLSDCA